ncbi:malonyl-ACP decarboxylase [Methylobacter tundripaludum]|uniref:Malonyl-ACP decarboxylase n=1 Tax=Methylobacter tundripaludum TaxID=173365 RepID=A0A2S6H070_9GAMM|nr:beta-ketoacyl synthase N-terminal-like domain-containing protein [Methylobacter tundripaludum]PPK70807.1 malonyl-ACP decarboxylase [Methylobacter tundripaludum]
MTEKKHSPKSSPCVQITGMGIVSAIGHNIAEFTRSLADGKSGVRRIARSTTPPLAVAIGAEIDGFNFEQMLGQFSDMPESLTQSVQHVTRRAPFTIQTSVISALQAWRQARLDDKPIEPERIGLVIAGHNTTQNYQYSLCSDFQRNPEYLSPRYALQFMDSNQIGVLSEIFNIRGEGFVTGGASASGNVGVIHGARLIQAGLVDACLVVGVVADLSPMEIQGFCTIGAMGGKQFHDQPEKACRPFDALHEGFIYGQASACLVLESGDSANARKAPGLANILGGAINLHATASAQPDIDGETKAMNAALQQSGLAACEIDYLNTHGSSSPLGDKVEIQAIEQVFGDHFPRVRLNATKGLTGHCLYSAGVVEIIATVVQMQQGFIHPNINLENPINATANFCGATAVSQPIHSAMSNSFGFGGINTSIVLQKIPADTDF